MNVGSNRVPRPDNILACGKPCMPTVTSFPYWGTPSPLVSASFNLSLLVQGPPANAGTPRTKKKRAIKPKLCAAEVSFQRPSLSSWIRSA